MNESKRLNYPENKLTHEDGIEVYDVVLAGVVKQ